MNRYSISYYTLSDGSHETIIEAETPEAAVEELRTRKAGNLDRVRYIRPLPRMIDTKTHCPACQKPRSECDCIPF